jgi:hypothetical protein
VAVSGACAEVALADRADVLHELAPQVWEGPAVTPGHPVLGQRALGRALLERQLLLRRAELTVPDAVTHLVAVQAQVPTAPYVALWSRVAAFDPHDLGARVASLSLVRSTGSSTARPRPPGSSPRPPRPPRPARPSPTGSA